MGLRELLYSLKIDLSGAAGPLDQLQKKVDVLQDDSQIELEVNAAGALGSLDDLVQKQNVAVRSIADWEAELKKLKAERDKAEDTDTLTAYNDKIREAEKEVKKLKDLTGDIPEPAGDGFDRYDAEVKKASKSINDLTKDLSTLREARNRAEDPATIAEYNQAIEETSKKIKDLEGSTGKSGSFLNTFFSLDAIGKAGEFLDGFSAKGAEAVQVQRSMQAATGLTGDALKQLAVDGEDAFKRGVGENVAEAQRAITTATQQLKDFLSPSEIEDFVVASAAMGKTWDKDVNEVIGGSRTLIQNFKLGGKEASDLMSFAFQNAGSKMDDLLDTTDEYSQHAKEAGFSAQEFVGVLTTGIQNGARDTDKLADAIKETKIRLNAGDISAGLAAISSPITASIQGIVQAGEQGKLSVKEVMQQSAQEIQKAFDAGQITDQTRAQLQTAISGSPAEDIGAELYGRIFSAPIDTQAIQAKAAEVGKLVGDSAAPQGIFAGIGKELEVFTTKASATFAPIISGAGGVLSAVGQIGPGVALLQDKFDVFGKGASLVGKLKDGATAIIGPLSNFTKGQAALNIVMNLNPAVRIAAILGVLAGAVYLAYQKSETFRNALDQLWTFIKAGGEFISEFVSNYVSSLIDAFTGVGDVISGIISLDFDQVKAGAAKVGDAVKNAYVGSAKAGADAFSKSLDDSKKKLAENKTQGEQTGTAIKQSFQGAKGAIDDVKLSAQALGAQFSQGLQASQTLASDLAAQGAAIEKELRTNKTLTDEQRAARRAELADIDKRGVELGKQIASDQKALQAKQDAYTGVQKAAKDQLAIEKALVDLEVRKLQQKLEAERFAKGESLTARDLLQIEETRLSKMEAGLTRLSAKQKEVLNLDIKDVQNKILQLQATIKIDDQKAAEEIKRFQDGVLQADFDKIRKEIEIGIRPKEEGINLIDREIRKLEADNAAVKLKLTFDSDGNAIGVDDDVERAAVEQSRAIEAKIFDLRKQSVQIQKDLDTELADARIANIDRVLEKERAELERRQAQELAYFTSRRDSGIALTEHELQVEKEIRERHAKELAVLGKKELDDKKKRLSIEQELTRDFFDESLSLLKDHKEDVDRLSAAEVEDRIVGFDKQRTELERQLQLGEISQREYHSKLNLLAEERRKFEEENNAQMNNSILDRVRDRFAEALTAQSDYFQKLLQQQILDVLLHGQAEQQKTQSTIEGANARADAQGAEAGGALTSARASIMGAAANQVAKVIALVPFPFNIPAAIAASLAVTAILGKITSAVSAIGFETGGLGLVGEKGPEIIGPTRDFSHFATQLVTSTVQAVRSEMKGESARGGVGSVRHEFSFQEARLSGDTIGLAVKGAEVKSATELLLAP